MLKIIKSVTALLLALVIFTGCALIGKPSPDNGDDTPAVECDAHIDVNDDGSCDTCRESVIVLVDIYAINDLHGKILESGDQPGVDELTTFLKNAKAKNENTVILSSGDMWQGSSESNITDGAMMTEWMNELDFVSMTIGNHEFDWGREAIEANLAIAEFPFLAINIYDKGTGSRLPYCEPSVVVECDGIEIGIIGAIGNCLSSISGDQSAGLEFKTGKALTSLIKEESERLRAEGVDVIVLSSHADRSEYDASLSRDGYVDVVFEGHSHQNYVDKDSYGVMHLQGGGENRGISYAAVSVNSVTGSSRVSSSSVIKNSVYALFDDDPIVAELLERYDELVAPLFETIAMLPNKMYGRDVLSLAASLYLEKGIEEWGDEYDIFLGGGYMSVRSPYDLPSGEISYSDIYSILPFDNRLVLCSISGSDLYYRFVNTTNSTYYISLSDYGEELKNSIDMNARYYIITDTYSSTYAPNGLTEIERFDEGFYARDLIAEYLKTNYS